MPQISRTWFGLGVGLEVGVGIDPNPNPNPDPNPYVSIPAGPSRRSYLGSGRLAWGEVGSRSDSRVRLELLGEGKRVGVRGRVGAATNPGEPYP